MKAVILAGGMGARMRPLTYVVPKVLLPVGAKPLLEGTIDYLTTYGISEIVVCVAYLKRQIMDSFKDGSHLGVKIEYAEADLPLGTAGQLKTAEEFIGDDTFLAMNGDIVTSLNLSNLITAHRRGNPLVTIALKRFEVKVPYGHVRLNDDSSVQEFLEKPTFTFMANAGVYLFSRRIFDFIPRGKVCSLETETFPALISGKEKVLSYFEDAEWADVGSMVDFERVNDRLLSQGSLSQH